MEVYQRPYMYLDRDRSWSENFTVWIELLRTTAGPLLRSVATITSVWFWWAIAIVGIGSLVLASELTEWLEQGTAATAAFGEPLPLRASMVVGLIVLYTLVLLLHLRVASICHGFYRAYHEMRTIPDIARTREYAGDALRVFMRGLGITIGAALMVLVAQAVLVAWASYLADVFDVVWQLATVVVLVAMLGIGLVLPAMLVHEQQGVTGLWQRLTSMLRGRWWWSIGTGTAQVLVLTVVCLLIVLVVGLVVNILWRFLGTVTDTFSTVGIVIVGVTSFLVLVGATVIPMVLHQSLGVVLYFSLRTHAERRASLANTAMTADHEDDNGAGRNDDNRLE